jgi:hypothetical protein
VTLLCDKFMRVRGLCSTCYILNYCVFQHYSSPLSLLFMDIRILCILCIFRILLNFLIYEISRFQIFCEKFMRVRGLCSTCYILNYCVFQHYSSPLSLLFTDIRILCILCIFRILLNFLIYEISRFRILLPM